MERIRVLLADDYPMIRAGIRSLLTSADDIDIVGEAANGEEALDFIQTNPVDVLVLDIKMPRVDGLEVARQLKTRETATKILALSAYGEREFVLSMFDAGVDGYLLKEEAPDTIIEAIRSIANGGQGWFSRKVSAALTEYLKGNHQKKLSPREHEVLELVVDGKTNQEIAYILRISQSTVEKCIYNIYDKLGVTSRVEAAVYAVREKLL
ncbi:MAG TPA: response regulator transcription factor [Anaerolineaceae bacterium]|jgi:DNA-binding NarL/FixJ family response regulator